jgi:hypothetical protein
MTYTQSHSDLGPVETSHGRIAVLTRRPTENRDVFCDFVASRGREGPLSILATRGEVAPAWAPPPTSEATREEQEAVERAGTDRRRDNLCWPRWTGHSSRRAARLRCRCYQTSGTRWESIRRRAAGLSARPGH